MEKIIIAFMFCYSIFGGDFRYNNWGDSPGMMLKNENLSKVTYQKDFKSKIFNTHYGDKIYNFSEESYFFYDELESLGRFRVTFNFIDNKLYKGTYEKEINENDKQVKLLRNHLIKIDINTSFEEVIDGIKRLRLLHKLIDEAVIKEYGWTDINLQNDFYDVEYLPEIDRIRYTIHPKARKEILKRLLMLNHQRYKEEVSENSKNIKPNHKKVDNQKKKYNFPKLF